MARKRKIIIGSFNILMISVLLIAGTHYMADTINGAPKKAKLFFEEQQVAYAMESAMHGDHEVNYYVTGSKDSAAPLVQIIPH